MTRIALCGVFDIPNYGDHLFPLVFRNEIRRRITDAEVILFSPFEAKESFVEDSHIYSLDDMEQMHRENPFDAVVVGGGEIIHWRRYGQKKQAGDKTYVSYPMDKVWVIPSYLHLRYGVPLLWNAPGIPYDFETGKELARFLFNQVNYLSVRNAFSAHVLEECGIAGKDITLVPDTGFALRSIATRQELKKLRSQVLPFNKPYAVFHCNRFLPQQQIDGVKHLVDDLKKRHYKIVLLPLAYTHGDDDELRNLAGNDSDLFMPDGVLSLKQIIAILAGAEIYIGTSLHGSVTSVVWGTKIVSFDYQKTQKTHDLYHSLGLDPYYTTDSSSLASVADQALREQLPVDMAKTEQRISAHFDTIAKIIGSHSTGHPDLSSSGLFSDAVYTAFSQEQENAGVHDLLRTQSAVIAQKTSQIESQNSAIDSLQKENAHLSQQLSSILSSKLWKVAQKLHSIAHPPHHD